MIYKSLKALCHFTRKYFRSECRFLDVKFNVITAHIWQQKVECLAVIVGMVIEWQLLVSRMSARSGNQSLVRAVRAAGACRWTSGVGNHSDEGFLWVGWRLREKKPGTEKRKKLFVSWVTWREEGRNGEKQKGFVSCVKTEKKRRIETRKSYLWIWWRFREKKWGIEIFLWGMWAIKWKKANNWENAFCGGWIIRRC